MMILKHFELHTGSTSHRFIAHQCHVTIKEHLAHAEFSTYVEDKYTTEHFVGNSFWIRDKGPYVGGSNDEQID